MGLFQKESSLPTIIFQEMVFLACISGGATLSRGIVAGTSWPMNWPIIPEMTGHVLEFQHAQPFTRKCWIAIQVVARDIW